MGRIVYAPRQLVKLIKDPAYAVYRQVLNLPEQVVSDWETPPWLRPIALFLQNKRPFKRCWPKTWGRYHAHSRVMILIPYSNWQG